MKAWLINPELVNCCSQISNALFAILMFVSVLSVSGNGLSEYEIKGRVLNHETGAPLPLAEVFISGTTYGSITDEKGEFELKTSSLPCQLVVSHISYATVNMMIDKESMSYITIELIPYKHELKEISVEAVNTRKENLKIFRKAFIGTDEFANTCTILNDSVLSFRWDSMVFSASAHQPVIIDNPKLGYKIKIIIKEFNVVYDPETYKRISKDKKMKPYVGDAVYQWLCNFHFIPYPPEEKRKQKLLEKTRLKVYYGSRVHFLRALHSGYPEDHGYYITPDFDSAPITGYEDLDTLPDIKIIFLDPMGKPDKLLIYPERSMVIKYFEDYSGRPLNLNREDWTDGILHQSEITFTSDKCMVYFNGTTNDYSLLYKGYFGNQKISTLLPDDFMPEK